MMKLGSLFSGIGGFEMGLSKALTFKTAFLCDNDKANISLLSKRFDDIPVYDDVKNINKQTVDMDIDILCGGFPCQNISIANTKTRDGLAGAKSGLWFEMVRIIEEYRPAIVVVENVPNIRSVCLNEVLITLHNINYSVEWVTISAEQLGAPHLRRRWFAVAYPNHEKELDFSFERNIEMKEYWNEEASVSEMIPTNDIDIKYRNKQRTRVEQLGNAIVPACSELIGHCIKDSFLISGNRSVFPSKAKINARIKDNRIISDQLNLWNTDNEYSEVLPQNGKMLNGVLYESNAISYTLERKYTKSYFTPCKADGKRLSHCDSTMTFDTLLMDMLRKLGTTDEDRIKYKYMVNPNFVEYMMNFPHDWTKNEA